MAKKIVAGNWKMNKNLQEGVALAKELTEVVKNPNCGVIICTPFIHLASVAEVVKGSAIELGAENCADKTSGAYTGEVSAEMVKSTGAEYVIPTTQSVASTTMRLRKSSRRRLSLHWLTV